MTLKTKAAKAAFAVFAAAAILATWQLVPDAESGYSWYCPHVKGHVQPSVPELSFAE